MKKKRRKSRFGPLRVVFCTTCRNRTEHLKQTLPRNLEGNPRSKFVVLNYNTEDDLVEWLMEEYPAEIESGRLVLYSCLDEPKFRMSHAKNMAHRCGILEGGEILVNLDADNYAGWGFEDFVQREFRSVPDIFMWSDMIRGVLPRGISGRIVVSKGAFLKLGGYDEKFDHWGSDDKDMHIRLKALNYHGVQVPPSYLDCINHNDKTRFRDYPEAAAKAPAEFEIHPSMITQNVANAGRFGCGTVYRNLDWDLPIELAPQPTRVFGIGMPKTGTTSLHHALGVLGLDSWHWSSAHVAKAIWQEMNHRGQSPTLERWYALSDTPIPLLYDRLDKAYPGSKFILTWRDEAAWLGSIERHFDPAYNKWALGWDNDPFSHRAHHLLFGRKDFDPDVMLQRYRAHNYDVRDYFASRPQDLLEVGLEDDSKWQKLCEFLDRPVPEIEYPLANGSLNGQVEVA